MLTRALEELISTDPYVAAHAGRWDFGGGVARPAVFTTEPAPAACPNPVVIIIQTGGSSYDTRGRLADTIVHTIKVWGDKSESDDALRALANRIRSIIHRCSLTVEGATRHYAISTPPGRVVDVDEFPGYIITITSILMYGGN